MRQPPQKWAVRWTWIAFVAALLPVLWRIHMLVWGAGWELAPEYQRDLTWYVVGLIVAETIAAALMFALVRPWGEKFPLWLVAGVASIGAALLTLLVGDTMIRFTVMTLNGEDNPILETHGWHRAFLLAHYMWWPLWPIGLWVAIVAFWKRRPRR